MYNENVRKKFNNTMLDLYDVEWAQQSKEIQERSKETFNNNPNRDKIIEDRAALIKNKTTKEKLEIQKKKNETILNKWGQHYMNDITIKEKISNLFFEKYGHKSHFNNINIKNKRIKSYKLRTAKLIKKILNKEYEYISHGYNTNKTGIDIKLKHKKCGSEFKIHQGYFKLRISNNKELCLNCNPILTGKSNMELELLEFIKENYNGDILSNVRTVINGELDVFIPELKLAFEFNGLYWHSEIHKDRKYHINKTNNCLEQEIQLIHIWEDDWLYKSDIIKSIILNKLSQSRKIYARKTEVREINDNKSIRKFLDTNHIQGFVGSKVKIGLFYDDELVSLMTFGSLRKSLGQKNKKDVWELLRFCNKRNYTIIGGASKLFKHFIKSNNFKEIISYSDTSRSNGGLYETLGFEFLANTEPNYYYIIDGVRRHRFNYRKDKLVREGHDINKTEIQIMNELGYNRIFDCGAKKWIFKNNI